MKDLNRLLEFKYTPENSDAEYSGKELILLCKGNVQYAHSLMDRLEWQHPETLIDEDLREGEIIEFRDQYILTRGEEIKIS